MENNITTEEKIENQTLTTEEKILKVEETYNGIRIANEKRLNKITKHLGKCS